MVILRGFSPDKEKFIFEVNITKYTMPQLDEFLKYLFDYDRLHKRLLYYKIEMI